jgi:hypothetical protein
MLRVRPPIFLLPLPFFLGAGGCNSVPAVPSTTHDRLTVRSVTFIPDEWFFFSGTDGVRYGDSISVDVKRWRDLRLDGRLYLFLILEDSSLPPLQDFVHSHRGSPLAVFYRDCVIAFITDEWSPPASTSLYFDVSPFYISEEDLHQSLS